MLVSLKKTIAFFSLTAVVLLSACSKNDSTPPVDPTMPPPAGTSNLQLSTSTPFGNVLTDASGRTLYFFAVDANGTSGCTGDCAVAWPAYYAGNETAPAGLNAADIATITRADGTKQTTYKGWPLYYFFQDAAKDETKGDGLEGVWFVAKPDYSIMLANNQLVGNDGKNYIDGSKEGTGVTQHMTDAAGRTVYAYTPDTFNKNTFTLADLSNNNLWPIYESDILNVPSAFKKDMMLQITSVGKKQLTYKGHPLYYFGADAKRGDTKGVSVPTPGVWTVLTVNTAALTAK